MPSRREFLKRVAGASGIVFVNCGLTSVAAHAMTGTTARWRAPVMLRGRPRSVPPRRAEEAADRLREADVLRLTRVHPPEGLRHLVAEVGADHVMIGTDYPFPWVTEPVDHVLRTPGLNDGQRAAILGGTATRLLGLGSPSKR